MNERIKELWEKSTVSMWPRPGKFTAGEYDYHLAKFAELIIKECADFVREYPEKYLTHNQAREIGFGMEEHFGVEE